MKRRYPENTNMQLINTTRRYDHNKPKRGGLPRFQNTRWEHNDRSWNRGLPINTDQRSMLPKVYGMIRPQQYFQEPWNRNPMNHKVYNPDTSLGRPPGMWPAPEPHIVRPAGPSGYEEGHFVKNLVTFPKKKKKNTTENVAKPINIEDAIRALECENELAAKSKQLVIWFPDPPLDREMVHSFHPAITKVYFRQPSTPRSCFVQLSDDANVEETMSLLRKQCFGEGKLKVELKHETCKRTDKAEDIDPYMLFVGNISLNTPADKIKTLYKGARVDIGPSDKIKKTRYAFVRCNTVGDAIRMLRETHGAMVGEQSLNVRFRRFKASVGVPGEVKSAATALNEMKKSQSNINVGPINEKLIKKETDSLSDRSGVSLSGPSLISAVKEEVHSDDEHFEEDALYAEQPEPYDEEYETNIKREDFDEDDLYAEQPDPSITADEREYDDEHGYYYENDYNEEEREAAAEQFVEQLKSNAAMYCNKLVTPINNPRETRVNEINLNSTATEISEDNKFARELEALCTNAENRIRS